MVAAASLPSCSTTATASSARASTPTTRRRSCSGPTGCSTASGPSRTRCGSAIRPAPSRSRRAAADTTNASLLDAFNGLLLAIPVLTALAALAALGRLPPGAARDRRIAHRPAVPGGLVPGPERLQGDGDGAARARASRSRCGELGRQPDPRAPTSRTHGGRWSSSLILFAVASVFVYSLPGLAGSRSRCRSGWCSSSRRAACGSTSRRVRDDGPPPPPGLIVVVAVAGDRGRRVLGAAQLSGFVGKVGQVQASAGRLSSPGVPRRGARDLAGGRLPDRPGRRRPAPIRRVALGLLAAAIGAFGAIRRREWGLVAMGASAVDRLRRRQRVRVDLRGGEGAGDHVPARRDGGPARPSSPRSGDGVAAAEEAGSARRSVGRSAGRPRSAWPCSSLGVRRRGRLCRFDAPGAARRPGRLRPACDELETLGGLTQDRAGRLPRRRPLRRLLAARHAHAKPRRLRARGDRGAPEKVWQQGLRDGLRHAVGRAARRVPLRDHDQGRLPEHRARRTSSRWFAPPPTCSGGATGRPRTCGIIEPRRRARRDARLLHRRGPQGRLAAGGTATVLPDPVVTGIKAWSRPSPFDAPGTATARGSCSAAGAGSSRSSTTARSR